MIEQREDCQLTNQEALERRNQGDTPRKSVASWRMQSVLMRTTFSSSGKSSGTKPIPSPYWNLAASRRHCLADGTISEPERDVILQIATRNGVMVGASVHSHLNCWLHSPPSDDLFEASIRAIRAMLDTLQPDVGDAIRRKLVSDYTAVAVASVGGVLGRTMANDERFTRGHIIALLEGRGGRL